MSNDSARPPALLGGGADIDDCIVSNGCQIYGTCKHSIISTDCYVGERAVVTDSVLLPGAVVRDGAHVTRAILGEHSTVEEAGQLGCADGGDIAVIGNDVLVGKGDN